MRCMFSALAEPDGEGLGTLGFHEAVARRMTTETGFSRVTRHDFENPLNAYYEVRSEWDTLRKERAMATNQNAINMEKVQASAERVLGLLSGAVLSGMIYLGDRMGLYQALQESGPVTSLELV